MKIYSEDTSANSYRNETQSFKISFRTPLPFQQIETHPGDLQLSLQTKTNKLIKTILHITLFISSSSSSSSTSLYYFSLITYLIHNNKLISAIRLRQFGNVGNSCKETRCYILARGSVFNENEMRNCVLAGWKARERNHVVFGNGSLLSLVGVVLL